MADTAAIEVKTVKEYIQDLCNATTGYDQQYLGRTTIFKGIRQRVDDTEHDILIHKEGDEASTYITNVNYIDEEDTNVYEITIFVETCEQFLRVMDYSFKPASSGDMKGIQITVKLQNNLYFQDDSIYKNGIFRELRLRFDSALNQKICWMKVEPENILEDIIIQGLQITSGRFLWFYTSNTASNESNHTLTFNYIYFKDCVFTKEVNDSTSSGDNNRLPINAYTTGTRDFRNKIIFNSCKISMHIRASEHGYRFSGSTVKFDTCSLYIEYSDLYDRDCPSLTANGNSLYDGEYLNSSIIIRNLALKIARGDNAPSPSTSGIRKLFGEYNKTVKNCAWDIEIYYYYIDNTGSGADTFYCLWSQNNLINYYLFTVNMENNFLSIRVKNLRIKDYHYIPATETATTVYYKCGYGYSTSKPSTSTPFSQQAYERKQEGEETEKKDIIYDETYSPGDTFDKPLFFLGPNDNYSGSYGVNVFNMGNNNDNEWVNFSYTDIEDGEHYTSIARWSPNVKLLSETDCKNPSVLNKWGFFVNQDYIYRALTSVPSDVNWTTDYWHYFYFDEDLRVYKNIPKGVAPEFISGRYYEKVARS